MSNHIRIPALLAALALAVACGDGAMPLAPETATGTPRASQSALLRTHAGEHEELVESASATEEEVSRAAAEFSDAGGSTVSAGDGQVSDAPVHEDTIPVEQQPFTWLGYPMPLLSGYMLSSGRKASQP